MQTAPKEYIDDLEYLSRQWFKAEYSHQWLKW